MVRVPRSLSRRPSPTARPPSVRLSRHSDHELPVYKQAAGESRNEVELTELHTREDQETTHKTTKRKPKNQAKNRGNHQKTRKQRKKLNLTQSTFPRQACHRARAHIMALRNSGSSAPPIGADLLDIVAKLHHERDSHLRQQASLDLTVKR